MLTFEPKTVWYEDGHNKLQAYYFTFLLLALFIVGDID